MTTMIAELYDALIDAGASEEKSRKAAEAIAAYETRFANLDVKLERISGELRVMKWQLGALMAGVGAILLKLFV